MKIGIVGTRGIPNAYGGFEQFAEQFSIRMAEKGHDVTVYTSHTHPYTEKEYKKVHIAKCYDPEHVLGTAGQFIYDYNCIKHSRKQQYDIILQLGYTSSTIWSWLYPKNAVLVTNMDGLEWRRTKYNKYTQKFLTYAEKWGVLYSDQLIADSKGIQDYLKEKYNATSVLVTYGAYVWQSQGTDADVLTKYGLHSNQYDLLIARFEPENNIETILKAYSTLPDRQLILIGNYNNNHFGKRMHQEYSTNQYIQFAGPVYNAEELNILRHHSRVYLHGHSVGGTNPSLLEAMGCGAFIYAHNNIFNKYILGTDAYYFSNEIDLSDLLRQNLTKENHIQFLVNNEQKIMNDHNWDTITQTIESYFNIWKRSA
jgi:glycosyltransferase involved in cell wall biosynthesis